LPPFQAFLLLESDGLDFHLRLGRAQQLLKAEAWAALTNG
jgi:hypothetical protein